MKSSNFLLFLLFPIALWANSNQSTHLVIWGDDGTKVAYYLQDSPKIDFNQGRLIIQTTLVNVDYGISDISKCTYEYMEKIPTEAKEIPTDEINYHIISNAIYMSLKNSSKVDLYTVNGTLVFSKNIQQTGEYFFSIENLPSGVYILKINKLICKILKQ